MKRPSSPVCKASSPTTNRATFASLSTTSPPSRWVISPTRCAVSWQTCQNPPCQRPQRTPIPSRCPATLPILPTHPVLAPAHERLGRIPAGVRFRALLLVVPGADPTAGHQAGAGVAAVATAAPSLGLSRVLLQGGGQRTLGLLARLPAAVVVVTTDTLAHPRARALLPAPQRRHPSAAVVPEPEAVADHTLARHHPRLLVVISPAVAPLSATTTELSPPLPASVAEKGHTRQAARHILLLNNVLVEGVIVGRDRDLRYQSEAMGRGVGIQDGVAHSPLVVAGGTAHTQGREAGHLCRQPVPRGPGELSAGHRARLWGTISGGDRIAVLGRGLGRDLGHRSLNGEELIRRHLTANVNK